MVKVSLSTIWLIFAVLFAVLSCFHFAASKTAIPPFERTQRPFEENLQIEMAGSGVDQPLDDFVNDFNGYLFVQNEESRKANLRTAFGYLLAALTALFSMALQSRQSPHLDR